MMQATFDATADGILVVDSEGNYIASNQIFHQMWRIPKHMLYSGQENAIFKFALSQIRNPEALVKKIRMVQKSSPWAMPWD